MARDRLYDSLWDQATRLLEKTSEQDKKKLKKGSLVMFRNPCHQSSSPRRISEVVMLGTHRMFRVDGHPALWPENSLMLYKDWVATKKENSNAS